MKALPRQMTLHDVEVGRGEVLTAPDLGMLAKPEPLPTSASSRASSNGDDDKDGGGVEDLRGFQITDGDEE